MVVDQGTDEIKEMIQGLLHERFKNEFEFGPIVVMPRYDEDGERYLHSYIVVRGDQKKLDPLWTLRLSGLIWPRAEELGYPGIPEQSFVERSEWPAMERSLDCNRTTF